MRLTIFALGSRGDVQPYIALGVGLQAAGHHVRIATHDVFASLLAEYDLEYFPMGGDPRAMLETKTAHVMLAAGGNPLRFLRNFSKLTEPFFEIFLREGLRAAQDVDAVVLSGVGLFTGFDITDKLGIPCCAALLQPTTPTRAFASPFFPEYPAWLPCGRGIYNRLTHYGFALLLHTCFASAVTNARRALHFPPLTNQGRVWQTRLQQTLMLFGFSPSVIPQPADWGTQCHVTGYWYLDHTKNWQPPADLADFLATGPSPVYIGFGSMRSRDPAEVTALVIEALARTRQRGILLTGWGGLHKCDLPETIFPIESAPHDWLFPRMSAVVHHGGAGTAAAGLRAGVPSIVVPFFADQPFWARTVAQAGVGPAPIPRQQLTAARLADAITSAVTDSQLQAHAAALGERIRAEDGVRRAVELIEQQLCGKQSHSPGARTSW